MTTSDQHTIFTAQERIGTECVPARHRFFYRKIDRKPRFVDSVPTRKRGFRRLLDRDGSDETIIFLSRGIQVMATSYRLVVRVRRVGPSGRHRQAAACRSCSCGRLNVAGYGLAPYCRVINPEEVSEQLRLFSLACVCVRVVQTSFGLTFSLCRIKTPLTKRTTRAREANVREGVYGPLAVCTMRGIGRLRGLGRISE